MMDSEYKQRSMAIFIGLFAKVQSLLASKNNEIQGVEASINQMKKEIANALQGEVTP
jgi:hypothetical protein